jgi:hypothetical protein
MAERFRIPWTTGKMEISHSDCATIPPAELVEEWADMLSCLSDHEVFSMAAQWGADQELEACCALLQQKGVPAWSLLRMHRRPKPPSLKAQALAELAEWENVMDIAPDSPIRRALEQLDD